MSLLTPQARARGLGSAKSGTHHWIAQRVTAVALIPLSFWFILSLVQIANLSYLTATEWLKTSWVAVLLMLFVVALFHHAQLGMQVIIEDYIGNKPVKIASLILCKFAILLAGLMAIAAILKIYLGP